MAEELHSPASEVQPTQVLFGISVFSGNEKQVQSILKDWLVEKNGQLRVVVTPNPEQVMLARQNPQFLEALQRADLALPDGIGLVVAGRLLSEVSGTSWSKEGHMSFPERLPGRHIFEWLVKQSALKGFRVLLVGGFGSVAHQAAERLQKRYPGLIIHSIAGPKDALHPTAIEQQLLENGIAQCKPHLVGVAFGAPKQELWLMNQKEMLRKNGVRVAMAIGGTLDVLAGRLQPVPHILEQCHLEWLFRLLQEPSRWRRQLVLPKFVFAVLRERYFKKKTSD